MLEIFRKSRRVDSLDMGSPEKISIAAVRLLDTYDIMLAGRATRKLAPCAQAADRGLLHAF